METLPINCSATKNAEEVNVVEAALNSPPQPDSEEYRLGQPVRNVLTPQDIISADYIPPQDYQWFFMNASHGRNLKAQQQFVKDGIFTYIPYETIKGVSSDGTTALTRRPIFASYLFVFAPLDVVKKYANAPESNHSIPYLHFVYNHAQKNEYGLSVRMVVSHKAMVNFIRLAEFNTYKVHSVDVKKVKFVKGTHVRITQGVFKGIEGRVARIHNQTTVVVTLDDIVSMTTAYIPRSFMEPLDSD